MSAEPCYFADPQTGKLADLVLQLACDLHVTRQRLLAVEMLLARSGTVPKTSVGEFEPTDEERSALGDARRRYLDRLMSILTDAGPAERPLRDQWAARLRTDGDAPGAQL